MSVSTDGQLSFGILFEEGYEFPWDVIHDGDIEDWWLWASGFEPSFYPYTPEGEYKEGVSEKDPRIEAYFDERQAFQKEHPLGIGVVNYCSNDCPMYILSNKGTSSRRGYPEAIDPEFLKLSDEAERLIEFCKKYGIEYECEPKWYLSSYWG